MCKLFIVTLSFISALKIEQAPKPALQHKHSLLRLRGGADPTEIAKYIVYGTSFFMFLPAGRDIVSPSGDFVPDENKLLGKIKDGYTFMWNQWCVNWILLSIVKILAVSSNSADFQKLGVAADLATLATMLNCRRRGHPGIPEFRPFVLLFGLEMIALGMLAFA